ncbi:hypothetical protein BFG04_08285 [Campylobacter pinnipediorum subsp. pinnipediorum]|uniref:Uncharacterized protein n=1 Tax=Campylobacter pinnipediorum subsp. pinnipediorum TaxID=1660067 RepID=A0AAX0LCH9_9BACT|nr:hypothetical protein [Campylobacter pinnipediorum]OPA81952.1 hypothetical protein BFG04_08285 [Campylobacter pinnipediorum subsp. pinnipediorum]
MQLNFKLNCLLAFREFLVYHHKSLEFRAKVFAAIIGSKFDPSEDDFVMLYDIANEIYSNDETRKTFLVKATKEYVAKIKTKDRLTLDSLLMSIDRDLKTHKRYAKKIDFAHLRRLMSGCEHEMLIQQRVYEFLISEVKRYLHII